MDFFDQCNPHLSSLSESERHIFEYVVKNIQAVNTMNIRALAKECYVSTTTVLRFVKKLGFQGYREFGESLRFTCSHLQKNELPEVFWKRVYSEEYLKNIIESVRVVSQEQIIQFIEYLSKEPTIFFYGRGLSREAAHYAYRLFSSLGYRCFYPVESYEKQISLLQMRDGDIIFSFSLSGQEQETIELIEQARLRCNPHIVSITQADNNVIQNLSDLNFYVFTDKVWHNGLDLTSRISMIAIVEMLFYSLLTPDGVTPYTEM